MPRFGKLGKFTPVHVSTMLDIAREVIELPDHQCVDGLELIAEKMGVRIACIRVRLRSADPELYQRFLTRPWLAIDERPQPPRHSAHHLDMLRPRPIPPFVGPPIYRSDFIRGECEGKVRGARA